MSEPPSPADAAWAFLLDVYKRPGVAAACLVLQDEAGVDVVELLMLLYADTVLDKRLPLSEIAALRAELAPWRQDAVLPLRALRRQLKPSHHDIPDSAKERLRADIKRAELLAERLQVDAMAHRLHEAPSGGPALATTLARLIPETRQSPAIEEALAHILSSCD